MNSPRQICALTVVFAVILLPKDVLILADLHNVVHQVYVRLHAQTAAVEQGEDRAQSLTSYKNRIQISGDF